MGVTLIENLEKEIVTYHNDQPRTLSIAIEKNSLDSDLENELGKKTENKQRNKINLQVIQTKKRKKLEITY